MSFLKSKLGPILSISFGVLAAIVYGILARVWFGNHPISDISGWYGTISLGFLIFVPLGIGALTQFFAAPNHKLSWLHALLVPWIASTVCLILASIFSFELIICIVLAAPLFYGMSSFGGFVIWLLFYLKKKPDRSNVTTLMIILLAPYVITPVEFSFAPQKDIRTIESTIVINASPETVWQNIIRFRHVTPGEEGNSLFKLAGLPRPLEATLTYEGVGAIRRGQWEDGLAFDGSITEWVPNSRYRLTLRADTRGAHSVWVPLQEIGGRYFDMLDDSYVIERLDNSRVRLHLSSTYRMTTRMNAYGIIWGDLFLRDIQEYILRIEKGRCESPAQ